MSPTNLKECPVYSSTRLIRSVGLTASLLLLLVQGSAEAQRFETTNTSVRVTFPNLRFSNNVATGGLEVICPVTIEGTFHSRTITKTGEQLVGYVTRAILNEPRCLFLNGTEGVSIQTSSLPWHIRYESFSGVLPEITRIQLRDALMGLILRAFGVSCLYKSSVTSPVRGWAERNPATKQVTNLTLERNTTIPRFEGSTFLCPDRGIFEGSGAVRVLGSTTTLVFNLLI
jgi:hypothetical protein